jgi:O-methyltransferase
MLRKIHRVVSCGLFRSPPDKLINKVAGFTLASPGKLRSLMRLCHHLATNNVYGDFVECGVYKGGSAAVLAAHMPPQSRLWLFDSFRGMPETTDQDGNDAKNWIGKCVASPDDVRDVMRRVCVNEDRFLIREGWFEDSFKKQLPDTVSMLHCDADWYDSVMLTLETFYHRIPQGGCVVLDDFGCWEGCREAFYSFCERHKERPVLERVEYDQAYWIKGKTHNRPLPCNLPSR